MSKIKVALQEEQLFEAKKRQEEAEKGGAVFVNSQKQRMIPVRADSFKMGGGDIEWNPLSLPKHKVTLKQDYYISELPVKVTDFYAYEKETFGAVKRHEEYRGFIIGVSYLEASAYTKWLSKKEDKPYHLPTEAEWEFAARNSEKLGLDRICDAMLREWCYDYYAPYTDMDVEDPAGPISGDFRVVRGGYLDNPKRLNAFPLDVWYRAAMQPDYRHEYDETGNDFGHHRIGFRLVCGRLPSPSGTQPVWGYNFGVRQGEEDFIQNEPLPVTPYYRKRYIFTAPPDNCTGKEIRTTGFSSYFRHHHHSPGFTVAKNGDLLYTAYSTYHEYDAESGLVGSRFRVGEDEWEFPDVFLIPTGVNDHGPLLDTDKDGVTRLFWGWPQLDHAYPFQYMESTDSGEHFGSVKVPHFTNKANDVVPQPVNSCISAADGSFYMVSDTTYGSSSVLWRSRDGLKTWEDPKGRTAGRHSSCVELRDGSLLAMGGKNSDIDGYMPCAISTDKGETFHVSKSVFPSLSSGQRPSITRLMSGRLMMCADFQNKQGQKPEEFKDISGSYVAWSDDEGKTWKKKKLWGTQGSKKTPENFGGHSTLGYSTIRQSKDGLIHVVCSNVHPLLMLSFNEAWLGCDWAEPSEAWLMKSHATKLVSKRNEYREFYASGALRAVYHGGIADDGRFLLDGEEKFYYEDGTLMRDGRYSLGKRVGIMVYYDRNGYPVRRFTCPLTPGEDTEEFFETFWEGSGSVKTQAFFRNRIAKGAAISYDREGKVTGKVTFTADKTPEDLNQLQK